MKKLTWQERCILTNEFHHKKAKELKHWGVRNTANELRRSVGSISEDLQLAHWLKVYPALEKFKLISDALHYIRQRRDNIRFK